MATKFNQLVSGLVTEYQVAQAELVACRAERDALAEENAELRAELLEIRAGGAVGAAACGAAACSAMAQGSLVEAISNTPAQMTDDAVLSPTVEPPPAEPWLRTWQTHLPQHVEAAVCKACVTISSRIAKGGLDEHRPHHGFLVVVGDVHALDDCGSAGFNPFQGHLLRVVDADGNLDEDTYDVLRRNAFVDGALVIDGVTGWVAAAGWFVSDVGRGGVAGGARSRAAKAIAQKAGGCFVIKCSEDSTGDLSLHLGGRMQRLGDAEDVATGPCTAAARQVSRHRSDGTRATWWRMSWKGKQHKQAKRSLRARKAL